MDEGVGKKKRCGLNFGALLGGADQEKFGFGGIERQMVGREPLGDGVESGRKIRKGSGGVSGREGYIKLRIIRIEVMLTGEV